jgi:hypothetical protein
MFVSKESGIEGHKVERACLGIADPPCPKITYWSKEQYDFDK